MNWASGITCLSASFTYCPPPKSPVLWQNHADSDPEAKGRGTLNNHPPEPRVTPSQQTHRHPLTVDGSQLPLICLNSADFFFFSVALSWPLPLYKQSDPGRERRPLCKAHCFSFTLQAPCGFSTFSFLFIFLLPLSSSSASYWKSAHLTYPPAAQVDAF